MTDEAADRSAEGSVGGSQSGPEADPLGAEARRLLAAVQDWARRAAPAPPSGHAGPECQWCPLCQLASVLRGEHPELAERMIEAGTALAGALSALVEAAAARSPGGAASTGRASTGRGNRPRPRPTPRVQPIRLTGDGESTDGGSTDGGSTDGGSTDGGSTDGGETPA